MEKRKISVVGHKNPDTDSICSAIAYAYLKNQQNPDSYEPRRAGNLNNETNFVLNYFGVETPELLTDVNSQVMDIDYRKLDGVKRNLSIKDAWQYMMLNDAVTLPVVKDDNILEGIITVNDIAKSYIEVYNDRILSDSKTPYSNIIKTLDGEMIVGNPHSKITNGKVLIATANPDLMEDYIDKDDIVILGDRYESQLCAIEMGAACLIICLNSKVSRTIQKLAAEHECNIITTPYDSYAVARIINQAIPIQFFMRKDHLITFQIDDPVDYIKETMSKLRHRDFPITDEFGHYLGMVSRRNLLALRKRQIVMVDHNERSQAVDGLENAEILEIIDHHKLGTVETLAPVYFRNQPVGCTATIIYQMFIEQKVTIPKEIAGLLCSAIISDTLLFRSPTCTPLDEMAANALAAIAEIEVEFYAMEMFEAASTLHDKTAEEIFYQDFKRFFADKICFGVGQITTLNQNEIPTLIEKVSGFLNKDFDTMKLDMAFFLVTNIFDQTSVLIAYGENASDYVEDAFHVEKSSDGTYLLENMVSRKKQFIPAMMTAMQQEDEI